MRMRTKMVIGPILVAFCLLVSPISAQDEVTVVSLGLDRDEVSLPCPPGRPTPKSCDDSMTLTVKPGIEGAKLDEVVFSKTVSGGRIREGSAPNEFLWDLSGMASGTYTISVVAARKSNPNYFFDPKIETIKVLECRSCGHSADACPVFSLKAPETAEAGKSFTVTLEASGLDLDYAVSWSISRGVIKSGMGTRIITIETGAADAGSSVYVSAQVQDYGGPPFCENWFSTEIKIEGPVLFHEFLLAGTGDLKARLDSYLIQLLNHSESKGAIEIYPLWQTEFSRISNTINQYIKLRGFDMSRVSIVNAGGSQSERAVIKLWRIPPTSVALVPKGT